MSQPDSNKNEPSKMKNLINGGTGESPMSRLPKRTGGAVPKEPEKPISAPKVDVQKKKPLFSRKPKTAKPEIDTAPEQTTAVKKSYSENRFLPTFWTIASVISMLVNVGVVIALVIVIQILGGTKAALSFAQSQANGLLGGLHENFVKMDEASIKTTIHVEKDIPVQFTLNVSGNTNVTLSQDVPISGALVTVNTGGLNINNASANIVLPAGTVLPIFIENLVVPVDKTVPAILDVPVDIPLNETELHVPFVGLQKVVEPYYCLLNPDIIVNGINVCANAAPIFPIAPTGTTTP
ncbi:MAG TPA: hypothetical protein VJ972_15560 [Anaerolineales bacterium]|nr:hypothetical protein [Anaerolineales bacterium]